MSEEITVYVIDKKRKSLYLKYIDPQTNRPVERSAKTNKMKAAIAAAGAWQADLRSGRYQSPSKVSWELFRESYTTNVLPGLASRTGETYESTLSVFEDRCNPARLAEVTTGRLTAFTTMLRSEGAAEATIAHHLRHLKVAMRWAHSQGMLAKLPVFTMPKRTKGAKVMRGRAITTEEFERMLETTAAVVDNAAAESWKFYLHGLWNSGLRLTESLTLRWDHAPEAIVVDLSGRRPMLRIPAEAEKGNQDRILPITPEFAEQLYSVPESERRGRVFRLLAPNGKPFRDSKWQVSAMVSKIGKKAGIVVDERMKGGNVVRKFASAHDLRRGFGKRWSVRIKPIQLKELMRHASLATTLAYYVGEDAEATADALWATLVDTSVDTSQQQENADDSRRQDEPTKHAK